MPKELRLTFCEKFPRIDSEHAIEKVHIDRCDFSTEDAWAELQSNIYELFGLSPDRFALKIHPKGQCERPFTRETFHEDSSDNAAFEVEFRKITPDDEDDDVAATGVENGEDPSDESSDGPRHYYNERRRKAFWDSLQESSDDNGGEQDRDDDGNRGEDESRGEKESRDTDENRNEGENRDDDYRSKDDENRNEDEINDEDQNDEEEYDLEAREKPKGFHIFNLGRQPGLDTPMTNSDEVSHQVFVVALCHSSDNIEIASLNAWLVNDLWVGNYESRTEADRWDDLHHSCTGAEPGSDEYARRFEPNDYFRTTVAKGTLLEALARLAEGETHEDIPPERCHFFPPVWPLPTEGSPPNKHADGGGSGPIVVVHEFVNDCPAQNLRLPVNTQADLEEDDDYEEFMRVVMNTDFSSVSNFSTLQEMLESDDFNYWCDLEVWVLPQGSMSEMYSWTANKDMKACDFMHTKTSEDCGKRQLYIEVWIKEAKDPEEQKRALRKKKEAARQKASKKRPKSTASTINKKGIAKMKSSAKRQKASGVNEASKAENSALGSEAGTVPPKPMSQVRRRSFAKVLPRRLF